MKADKTGADASGAARRRWLVAGIAVAALLGFAGMWLQYQISAATLFYGAWIPLRPPPGVLAGAFAHWYALLSPVRIALFAAGLISVCLLAATFVFAGKERLHRRSAVWWIFTGLLGALILVGQGGKYLPIVDFGSNTEAFFEHIADSQYGAGALLWLIVALFVERGIAMRPAGGEAPGLRRRAAAKASWIIALSLASLAWLAISAGGNETRESGSEYQSIERRVCGATHVIVGTARDFEVVREADCAAYDDRRPDEGAGVLGRCESLQFKVDVLDQVWPLPDPGQRVESVRTFRQSRVRADAEKLRYNFSVGWYDGRVGAPGPRVFYGRASTEDGAAILRNSWREGVFSTEVLRDRPRYVDSPIARCGPKYKLAQEVRMACPWDYAFVGAAKSFRRAPPGSRLPDLPIYAEARSQLHPSQEDHTILEAGDAVEIELEVIENFDALRPVPKDRQFFMRLPVAERTELGQVRAAWSDENDGPLRSVFFMLEDRSEPGLLDGARKWDEHYMLFPAWKYDFHGERGPSQSAKRRLHACNTARAAVAGEEPPVMEKDPPKASERYLEIWQDRADKALAKVCATRSLDARSVTIGIYIVPDGKISRVVIERASKDARFDQRVVDALKTVEPLPPFPAQLRQTAGMHLSRSLAPVQGWCWGR